MLGSLRLVLKMSSLIRIGTVFQVGNRTMNDDRCVIKEHRRNTSWVLLEGPLRARHEHCIEGQSTSLCDGGGLTVEKKTRVGPYCVLLLICFTSLRIRSTSLSKIWVENVLASPLECIINYMEILRCSFHPPGGTDTYPPYSSEGGAGGYPRAHR